MEWDEIRSRRNNLLYLADKEVNRLEDVGKDASVWRDYRVLLRDIPQTYSDPDNVIWPDKPVLPE